MLIFLNVINPTNLTNLSDLTSEFRETSSTIVEVVMFLCNKLKHWYTNISNFSLNF